MTEDDGSCFEVGEIVGGSVDNIVMAENDEKLDNGELVEENVDNIVMAENDQELDNGEL